MKRILSIFFVLIFLCLPIIGCGEKAAESEDIAGSVPEPDDYNFVICVDDVAKHLSAYLASESYLSGVAAYETYMQSKGGGCLLEKALEYHLKDLNGYPVDAILLSIKTDVSREDGAIHDAVQIYIDLNSGEVCDSISADMESLMLSYDGMTVTSEAQMRAVMMNVLHGYDPSDPVFWSSQGFNKSLSAEEIASVNEKLGLSYRGYASAQEANDSVDAETGSPIIHTDAQERVQKVIDMATAFQTSSIYQEIAFDPTAIQLAAAMEYKNDNFASGYPVHIIMIYADNIDTDLHGVVPGIMLMDMNSGEMYTYSDFDFNNLADMNALTSVEDAFPQCMNAYVNILEGRETQLWASKGETIVHLSEEELSFVNDALAVTNAAFAAEQDAQREAVAAKLTERQKMVFDAALEFSKTARYKETALNPASFRLAAASEFFFTHPDNGFALHALLLQAENVDVDMYGFSAAIFLKDLKTGETCTDTFMDLSDWMWDWEDYSDRNNPYAACILVYEQVVNGNTSHIFMDADCDRLEHLTDADLEAINAALNP